MNRILTNNSKLPLTIAAFLAHDNYDYNPDSNYYSATSIIKSVRQIILERRGLKDGTLTSIDLMDRAKSRLGTSIHELVQCIWVDEYNRNRALTNLGFSQEEINRIMINPKKEEIKPDSVPVYIELRTTKELDGFKISGKLDMAVVGKILDIKTTSTYTYTYDNNRQKYIEQGSIYKWLNPEIITDDHITIIYYFTDFKKGFVGVHKGYPEQPILPVRYPLMSLAETEAFLRNKIAQIQQFDNVNELKLPLCTDDDLWVSEPKYKYYAGGVVAARCTRNFDSLAEAETELRKRGKGIIKEEKGKAKACNYCSAFNICTQKDMLIQEGRLDVEDTTE